MSSAYYTSCSKCSTIYGDSDDSIILCDPLKCKHQWCSIECAIEDGWAMELIKDTDVVTCKYCREEDLEDDELVKWLLDRLNYTREEAVDRYFGRNDEHHH